MWAAPAVPNTQTELEPDVSEHISIMFMCAVHLRQNFEKSASNDKNHKCLEDRYSSKNSGAPVHLKWCSQGLVEETFTTGPRLGVTGLYAAWLYSDISSSYVNPFGKNKAFRDTSRRQHKAALKSIGC